MDEGRPTVLLAEQKRDEPRRGRDRRAKQRRAPQRPLDPLFAATLVNQIAPPEAAQPASYPPKNGPRAGIAFDLKV